MQGNESDFPQRLTRQQANDLAEVIKKMLPAGSAINVVQERSGEGWYVDVTAKLRMVIRSQEQWDQRKHDVIDGVQKRRRW